VPFLEAMRLALQTIRAQKLKSGFSLLGVFIGVASLIGAWSIVNGVNRYMTEKFAQTIFGVNTFQLRRRPVFTPNVPDSVWRAWRRRRQVPVRRSLAAGPERADRRRAVPRDRRGGTAGQHSGIPARSLRRRTGAVTGAESRESPGDSRRLSGKSALRPRNARSDVAGRGHHA